MVNVTGKSLEEMLGEFRAKVEPESQYAGGKGSRGKVAEPLPRKEGDWSQLAELIMEAEIRDEILNGVRLVTWKSQQAKYHAASNLEKIEESYTVTAENMQGLGLRTGMEVELLMGIKESISSEDWDMKKLERIIRMEKTRNVLSDWAELEFLALQKLKEGVEVGKIKETGELLAIATMAIRTGQMHESKNRNAPEQQSIGISIGVNNQFNGGSQGPMGELPGAGVVGTINLNLSHRVAKQIEGRVIQKEESFLESIQMLSAAEVPELLIERGAIEIEGEES